MARRLEVEVGGWEHVCCGPELSRLMDVEWTVAVASDGRLVETHHDLDDLEVFPVVGTIVDLEAVGADGSRTRITRIPYGSALGGVDADDPGDVTELRTDRPVDVSENRFIVTVDVAD